MDRDDREPGPVTNLAPPAIRWSSKQATVVIPDDLAEAVGRALHAGSDGSRPWQTHESPPPLTAIVDAARGQYLNERGYLRTERPLSISPAPRGSGRRDVSQAHDRYLGSE